MACPRPGVGRSPCEDRSPLALHAERISWNQWPFRVTLSAAQALSEAEPMVFKVRMASSGLTTVVNSTPLTRSNSAANT